MTRSDGMSLVRIITTNSIVYRVSKIYIFKHVADLINK